MAHIKLIKYIFPRLKERNSYGLTFLLKKVLFYYFHCSTRNSGHFGIHFLRTNISIRYGHVHTFQILHSNGIHMDVEHFAYD